MLEIKPDKNRCPITPKGKNNFCCFTDKSIKLSPCFTLSVNAENILWLLDSTDSSSNRYLLLSHNHLLAVAGIATHKSTRDATAWRTKCSPFHGIHWKENIFLQWTCLQKVRHYVSVLSIVIYKKSSSYLLKCIN